MMNELEVIEPRQIVPAEEMNRAGMVAAACKAIAVARSKNIQGRNFVQVEGWQAIACANGCTLGARDVKKVEGGVSAIGEVRRVDTGEIIAEAEGFVGEDEPVWYGGVDAKGKRHPRRPDFAIRAMAQTRAMSRAGRSAFAHVVVLMDANLSTTPAEEMDAMETEVIPEPAPPKKAAKVPTLEERREKCAKAWVDAGGTVKALEERFGKPIGEFDDADLDFASYTFAKAKEAGVNPDEQLRAAVAP